MLTCLHPSRFMQGSSRDACCVPSATDPLIGPPAFVGRAGAVARQTPQLSVRDAKQFGHFARLQAGTMEILYRQKGRCVRPYAELLGLRRC